MQNIIIRFLAHFPPSIGMIPYHLAYYLVVSLAFSFHIKCWARNSYLFRNIVPGLSDIDFSLLVPNSSFTSLNLFLTSYRRLKKIIPILGEINIYHESELFLIEKVINYYELMRDSALNKKLFSAQQDHTLEKIVYLLRMIEADFKNLTTRSKLREKKWAFHFKSIGLNPPAKCDLISVVHTLSKLTESFITKDKLEMILIKMSQSDIATVYHEATTPEEMKKAILLYPHRWLVYANGLNQTEHYLDQIQFSSDEEQLILMQMKWELFGLITQRHNLSRESNVMNYLKMIRNFLEKIKGPHQNNREALSKTIDDIELIMNVDFSYL